MRDKVDFVLSAPSARNTFREAVDLANISLNLAQVAWLVEGLVRRMLLIKVTFSVDCTGQTCTVVGQTPICFERCDSNDLLIEFTCTVMQAVEWTNISLVDLVVSDHLRVREVRPVVAEYRSFIRSPTSEAMDQDYRVLIRPLRRWKVVIATVLVALPRLPIQSSLLTLIQFDDEHVKALDDEGKHRYIQVLGHDVSISSASTKCRRQSFREGL